MINYIEVDNQGRIHNAGVTSVPSLDMIYKGGKDTVVLQTDRVAHYGQQYWDGTKIVDIPPNTDMHKVFSYTTKQWEDNRSLDELKQAKWNSIKQSRTQAEYGGFMWDSSKFDSDSTSQSKLAGAVTLAQLDSTYTVNWILADNTIRTLSSSDLLAIAVALGEHVNEQFTKSSYLRLLIDSAKDKETLSTIVW